MSNCVCYKEATLVMESLERMADVQPVGDGLGPGKQPEKTGTLALPAPARATLHRGWRWVVECLLHGLP